MSRFSNFSREELRQIRKGFEASGSTGANSPIHHEANCDYTDKMSDAELLHARQTRSDGGPQATAALQRRGYNV